MLLYRPYSEGNFTNENLEVIIKCGKLRIIYLTINILVTNMSAVLLVVLVTVTELQQKSTC